MAGLGLEVRAIDGIAHQGVADMGQMYPDLMGAAGLELAGQERGDRFAVAPVEGFPDLPMGDGLAAVIAYRHLFPGKSMPVDRRVDGAALAVRHVPDEGHIAAPHRAGAALI